MAFNRQLRILRTQKNMTQAALADAIGTERKNISRWELAKGYPSEDEIAKLCRLFSVPQEFLVGGKPDPFDPVERSIFEKVHQLSSRNKGRVEQFVGDLLVVQNGEQKLEHQEIPVRSEANKLTGGIRCSFCGRPRSICDRLIAGNNSYICNECVKLCAEVLQDEKYKRDEE